LRKSGGLEAEARPRAGEAAADGEQATRHAAHRRKYADGRRKWPSPDNATAPARYLTRSTRTRARSGTVEQHQGAISAMGVEGLSLNDDGAKALRAGDLPRALEQLTRVRVAPGRDLILHTS
jgi:hypothetical protein